MPLPQKKQKKKENKKKKKKKQKGLDSSFFNFGEEEGGGIVHVNLDLVRQCQGKKGGRKGSSVKANSHERKTPAFSKGKKGGTSLFSTHKPGPGRREKREEEKGKIFCLHCEKGDPRPWSERGKEEKKGEERRGGEEGMPAGGSVAHLIKRYPFRGSCQKRRRKSEKKEGGGKRRDECLNPFPHLRWMGIGGKKRREGEGSHGNLPLSFILSILFGAIVERRG